MAVEKVLLEDDVSYVILEDASGDLLLESSSGVTGSLLYIARLDGLGGRLSRDLGGLS